MESDAAEMRIRCRNRPTQWIIRASARNSFGEPIKEEGSKITAMVTSDEVSIENGENATAAALRLSPLNPDAPEFVPGSLENRKFVHLR